NNTREIAERYLKFKGYLAKHPCKDMTWNVLLEVLRYEYTKEDIVDVSGREVPLCQTASNRNRGSASKKDPSPALGQA
ncbi:hypothetical protein, partial [Salmonella sp. SAL04284]|uniref:hypothetical protein n=1 Tax=Salmonella sp. SAL04284 TaxID=3159862 RepID=UPI0039787BC2